MSDFKGTSYSQPAKPELGKIDVCRWPDRKQVALGITIGSACHILAYFRSEDDARAFIAWMNGIAEQGEPAL